MTAWARSVSTTAVTVPAGSAEAIFATLPALGLAADSVGAEVYGCVGMTTAASTTSCRIRVRRNALTGTTVGDSGVVPVSASTVIFLPIYAFDAVGSEQAGLQYVITVTMAAAGAAATLGLGGFSARAI